MANTIISCCRCHLGPPATPKQAAAAAGAGARRPQAPPASGVSVSPSSSSSSHALRRACVAAAACAVIGMAGRGEAADMALALARGGGAAAASRTDDAVTVDVAKSSTPRWSDRRQCPPWRANSLENTVPENLPRPSAPRRSDSVSASAAAPADLVLVEPPPSFLSLRPGTGCFSL